MTTSGGRSVCLKLVEGGVDGRRAELRVGGVRPVGGTELRPRKSGEVGFEGVDGDGE